MTTTALAVPGRAIVRTAVAPMYAEPHVTSIQISQRLCGHDLDLLELQDDWFRVRGMDGYEGWIHRGFLAPVPGLHPGQPGRVSLGCVTGIPGGERRALPLGAILAPSDVVLEGEVVHHPELATRFPREALAIVRSALEYFQGTSYLWGGVTPWGADCSGFAQTIYGLHGVRLPRDAWQQSEAGEPAGDLMDLAPAELAFFSDREDRRVTHIAIAMGQRRLVHCALGRGGYAVEALEDRSDAYVARLRERFLRARRVL